MTRTVFPGQIITTYVILVALLLTFSSVLPGTVKGETFKLRYKGGDKDKFLGTLAPNETHIYHITFDYPDNIFDYSPVPDTFRYFMNTTNNRTFNYYTLTGHTQRTNGSIANHSTTASVTLFYGFFDLDEEERQYTLVVEAASASNMTYKLDLYVTEMKPHPRDRWFFVGVVVIMVVTMVAAVRDYKQSPKYKKSTRTIRHTPQDIMQFFGPSSLPIKFKIRAKKRPDTVVCSFCKTSMGNVKYRLKMNPVLYCDECGSLLEVKR